MGNLPINIMIKTKFIISCIVMYCIVLKGWSLLPDVLRPFQDLFCSPEFRYYWDVNMPIKFCSEAYFSGLRFFNEPEISDSGPPA